MSDDNKDKTGPAKGANPANPDKLRCTVLVSNTVIGGVCYARGQVVLLAENQAASLAGLNPPLIRIDGI